MKTLKFKTNINCGGCVSAVTPSLNSFKGIQSWTVDTVNPDKVLIIEATEGLSADRIISFLSNKGYTAKSIL